MIKHIRLIVSSTFILFACIQVKAQTAVLLEKYTVKSGEIGIPYEKWQLPNGLVLIVNEDHSDPIVHVEVTYKVGSNRETRGKSGFAHFFEHMMFQGSKNVADEQHFKLVQGAGGEMNGSTNSDRTNYFETLPSNQLEVALWLEADRMGFLLDSVTQKKFEVQRATVKNEKAQNFENRPYALSFVEKIPEKLYPAGHPYSWSTIGYIEDLDRVNVEDLKSFFMRWYGPNNAIVVVSGDVNTANVVKLTEKYFGPIPMGPKVKPVKVDKVTLATKVFDTQFDNVYLPYQTITYPSTPLYSRDEAPMDILASLLGTGVNSPMYKNLVKTEKAVGLSVGNSAKELAGEFQIIIGQYPNITQEEILTIVNKTIADFNPLEVTDEQLLIAKKRFETGFLSSIGTVQTKATFLTYWETYESGKPFNIKDEVERYNKVTKADLQRVFNKYIKDANPLVLQIVPFPQGSKDSVKSQNPFPIDKYPLTEREIEQNKEYEGLTYTPIKDNFDRSKTPTVSTAKAVIVPDYYEAKLTNGMAIIGTKTSEVPYVNIFLGIKGGHLLDAYNPNKTGLPSMVAQMMNEGTQKYTKEQLEVELGKLGSSISFYSAGNEIGANLSFSPENADKTLEIFKEMLFHPKFDEEDFKRVKNENVEDYYSNLKNAGLISNKIFAKLIYGENNILGVNASGNNKTLKSISLSDVKEFYEKYITPQFASAIIVGDISKEEILPKLQTLNEWKTKDAKIPTPTFDNKIEKTEIYLVDKINAKNSEIKIGFPAFKFDYNGEFFKANLMNFALGGNFNSRLNLILREEKGWTYGARTGFSGSEYPGYFIFSASVKTNATDSAIREFFTMLKDYRDNGMTDDEFEYMKKALRESEALKYQSSFQKASFLSNIQEYKLPKNYVQQQNEIIKNISKEELNNLAKTLLNPDKMVITVVGDEEYIKKGLESLGYGKLKKIDPDKISVPKVKE